MLLKLTAMILSHVSSALSRKGSSLSHPALFTTMSSWPNCARASSTARLTSARRVRSQPSASPLTPSASISCLTASALSARMSSTATSSPSCARPSAMARPMPRPPPVTSAVLPLSFMTLSLLSILPNRFALLDKRAKAFLRVFGNHQLVVIELLEHAQSLFESRPQCLAHGALGQAQHDRALGRVPGELRLDGLGQLVGGRHPVH